MSADFFKPLGTENNEADMFDFDAPATTLKEEGDIFGRDFSNDPVRKISIALIDDYELNPFPVDDDEEMDELAESIRLNGIAQPAIVFEKEDGHYQLVSGHRRKFACKKIGLDTLDCIVVPPMDMDDMQIRVVDCNRYRKSIPPSVTAKAVKMEYDAYIRKKNRTNAAVPVEKIGEDFGISRTQIFYELALAKLPDPILDLVDNDRLKKSAARHLTKLNDKVLNIIAEKLVDEEEPLSLTSAQAERLGKRAPATEKELNAVLHSTRKVRKVKPKEEDVFKTRGNKALDGIAHSKLFIDWVMHLKEILPLDLDTDEKIVAFLEEAVQEKMNSRDSVQTMLDQFEDNELLEEAQENGFSFSDDEVDTSILDDYKVSSNIRPPQ